MGGGGKGRAERGFGKREEVRRGRRGGSRAARRGAGRAGRPPAAPGPRPPASRAACRAGPAPLGSRQKAISELHRKCVTLPEGRAGSAGPNRGPSRASAEGGCQSPGTLGERGPLSTSPAFEVTGMEVLN